MKTRTYDVETSPFFTGFLAESTRYVFFFGGTKRSPWLETYENGEVYPHPKTLPKELLKFLPD